MALMPSRTTTMTSRRTRLTSHHVVASRRGLSDGGVTALHLGALAMSMTSRTRILMTGWIFC